jgi:hypothetical protein
MQGKTKLFLDIDPYASKTAYYESYTRFTNFTLRNEQHHIIAKGTTLPTQNSYGWNSGRKGYTNYIQFLKDNNLTRNDVEIRRNKTYFDSGNIH